jgi:hypothetical protein
LTTLDGAALPDSMIDSLKTVLHAGTNADMFRDCEIDFTFLPSAPIG